MADINITNGNVTMRGQDAVFAGLAECYIHIKEKDLNINFMSAINLEARMEKIKVEVPILGRTGRGTKAVGWKGTGSATFHLNTSVFRELMQEYGVSGHDFYFDMHVRTNDPITAAGQQYVILENCNLDSVIVAKFDADGEYLEEDFDFTFEGWRFAESAVNRGRFTPMDGMFATGNMVS